MKKRQFLVFQITTGVVIFLVSPEIKAQEAYPAAGGNAKGTGGSISYSIGQVAFSCLSGNTGTIIQGIQQPFEITTVTGQEDEQVQLGFMIFPNPVESFLQLTINDMQLFYLHYQLTDMNGIVLQEKPVTGHSTQIDLTGYPPGSYYLTIFNQNNHLKVFKIVKFNSK